jgi:hypothetical protein
MSLVMSDLIINYLVFSQSSCNILIPNGNIDFRWLYNPFTTLSIYYQSFSPTILMGAPCYLIVVLICILMMADDVEQFFIYMLAI